MTTDLLAELEADPITWLLAIFPHHYVSAFADHHLAFWDHVWAIVPGIRPDPYIAIWPRGGAKTTSAEDAVAALGVRGIRRYFLYISETQDQADLHVENIMSALESNTVAEFYPAHAAREMTKYGYAKGWRRNRLRTAGGFTVDALGLDTAARGMKIEEVRPDGLVLDDIDGELDTSTSRVRKERILTRKILPALTSDAFIIGIQNLILIDGMFDRIATGKADYLVDRILSGPIPAIKDMEISQVHGRYRIIAGTPTWKGMDLGQCQQFIDTYGVSSFRAECQHEVDIAPGGMFDHVEFMHCKREEVPKLDRIVLWMDPAGSAKTGSAFQAFQCDGISRDGTLYRLYSWEQRATPQKAMSKAIEVALAESAEYVGVETDFGGDAWLSVFNEAITAYGPAAEHMRFKSGKVSSGHGAKAERVSQQLRDYETGRIIHVEGTHGVLEAALHRFPLTPPLDLADVCWHSWRDLRAVREIQGTARLRVAKRRRDELPVMLVPRVLDYRGDSQSG